MRRTDQGIDWAPGPLHAPPRRLYPPYTGCRRTLPTSELERTVALLRALGGIELGTQDACVVQWLARRDVATVATIAVLIHRARLAGPRRCAEIRDSGC